MNDVTRPRVQAQDIFLAGVKAADPFARVDAALNEQPLDAPKAGGKTYVIAVGKAAIRMAQAAQDHVAGPCQTLVLTNYENAKDLPGATVFAAGHPIPDENGAKAAQEILKMLKKTGAKDRVLALISGGGSALMPAPVAGVSLAEKADVNALLLASGADITEMNLIRQQLSRLKGGGLAASAWPSSVRSLILSDVVGDDLRTIASGPTTAPLGNKTDARGLLKKMQLWSQLPQSVQKHLQQADREAAPLKAHNQLVGSNAISVAAMQAVAPGARVHGRPLEGDVAEAAAEIIASADGPGLYLFGGETTVQLKGDGLGGRNQELALRVAMLAEAAGWGEFVFLSGGTDGRDGPCDAAGGIVDAGSLARMRAAGIDPQASLGRNDSYHALQSAQDLLVIGATDTNVADLQILIRL